MSHYSIKRNAWFFCFAGLQPPGTSCPPAVRLSPDSPLVKKRLVQASLYRLFLLLSCPAQCSSIFSINIPKPFVGSCTKTCVTAPISFPFCMIGDPDIPCTIPPVFSSSSSSVTRSTIPLFTLSPDRCISSISTSYSFRSFSTLHRITAGPGTISCFLPISTGSSAQARRSSSCATPKIPAWVFSRISPRTLSFS